MIITDTTTEPATPKIDRELRACVWPVRLPR
jgi:hypothetical protein